MKHTSTNKDILQTQDMSYKKDATQLFGVFFDSNSESLSSKTTLFTSSAFIVQ